MIIFDILGYLIYTCYSTFSYIIALFFKIYCSCIFSSFYFISLIISAVLSLIWRFIAYNLLFQRLGYLAYTCYLIHSYIISSFFQFTFFCVFSLFYYISLILGTIVSLVQSFITYTLIIERLKYLIYTCYLTFLYIILYLYQITFFCVTSLFHYALLFYQAVVSLVQSFIAYFLISERLGYLISMCYVTVSYIIAFLYKMISFCVFSLFYYIPFVYSTIVDSILNFNPNTLISLIKEIIFELIYSLTQVNLSLYQSTCTALTQLANFFGILIYTILLAFLLIQIFKYIFIFVFVLFQDRNQLPGENIREHYTQAQTENTSHSLRTVSSTTNEEDLMCVVCYSNRKCILLHPCNHACVCIDCAGSLTYGTIEKQCPLCRVYIAKKERIYISTCVVCNFNQEFVLMRPCNHACVCPDCFDRNTSFLNRCPLCGVHIKRTERIYI